MKIPERKEFIVSQRGKKKEMTVMIVMMVM